MGEVFRKHWTPVAWVLVRPRLLYAAAADEAATADPGAGEVSAMAVPAVARPPAAIPTAESPWRDCDNGRHGWVRARGGVGGRAGPPTAGAE